MRYLMFWKSRVRSLVNMYKNLIGSDWLTLFIPEPLQTHIYMLSVPSFLHWRGQGTPEEIGFKRLVPIAWNGLEEMEWCKGGKPPASGAASMLPGSSPATPDGRSGTPKRHSRTELAKEARKTETDSLIDSLISPSLSNLILWRRHWGSKTEDVNRSLYSPSPHSSTLIMTSLISKAPPK